MASFTRTVLITMGIAVLMIALAGCGSDNKNNPIAAFQPEVINNADAFQFQITDATNVTTTLTYSWTNTGTGATVNHSTATTAGTAAITIFDADSTQVYSSGLLASGTEATATGTTGTWTIQVAFADFDGTVNFRVEKM